jgi:hypothetical protein
MLDQVRGGTSHPGRPFQFPARRLLPLAYGQDELERAGAYRVYDEPADPMRHLDEVGIRTASTMADLRHTKLLPWSLLASGSRRRHPFVGL